jgi:uncharacterized protein
MDLTQFFIGNDGRFRSGWRFAIFCLSFALATFMVATAGTGFLVLMGIDPSGGMIATMLITSVMTFVSALVVGWLCGKFLEGVPFRAIGAWFTDGWLRNLFAGLLVGAATVGFAILIAVLFGRLTFELSTVHPNTIAMSLLVGVVIFAVGAAAEEVLFRGYILQTFSRSGLAWIGIAITSLFFGFVHAGNPNANIISTVDTVLAGVWFGVAYLKTRDLWFVTGMHFMWNWMLGSVFGIEVSGITDFVAGSLLREVDAGPTWLTGGTYGLEGGIASTISLVISTAVIHFAPWPKASEEMVRLTSKPEHSGSEVTYSAI